MRPIRPIYFTILSLFLTLFTINITARAADDDDTDEYDVKARVVRISFVAGEVKLKIQLVVYDAVIPAETHFIPELNVYGGPFGSASGPGSSCRR